MPQKKTQSRSKSPAKTIKKSNAKPASSSGVAASGKSLTCSPAGRAPRSSNPSEHVASHVLQRVCRGGVVRQSLGNLFSRALRLRIDSETAARAAAAEDFLKQRRAKLRGLERDSRAAAVRREEAQEALSVAAFEGNLAKLRELLAAGDACADAKDAQGNYAVGEAAVNGQVAAIELLVDEHDANPNAAGGYGRTPLWRAAFNSHDGAIAALLERGADPKVSAQGELPIEICSGEAKAVLEAWDHARTEALKEAFAKRAEVRRQTWQRVADQATSTMENTVAQCKTRLEIARKKLHHAKCEKEKRIVEYDTVAGDPSKSEALISMALASLKRAEEEVTTVLPEVEAAEQQYLDARAHLAQHKRDELGEEFPGILVPLTMIHETVVMDAENQWRRTNQWPLIVDPTARCSTFLRYRDTNYLDSIHPQQMRPESIRLALLGALRYGKPLVIDLHDIPLLDSITTFFDEVQPGLWEAVLNKKILDPEHHAQLIRPGDGDELSTLRRYSVENFMVIILTSSIVLEGSLDHLFVVFRVEMD